MIDTSNATARPQRQNLMITAIGGLLFCCLLIGVSSHAFLTNSTADLLYNIRALVAIFWLVSIPFCIDVAIDSTTATYSWIGILSVTCIELLGIPWICIFIYDVYVLAHTGYRDALVVLNGIHPTLDIETVFYNALLISFPILMGFLLFAFRLKMRTIYGIVESLVGVLIFVSKVESDVRAINDLKLETGVAILTGSLYLVVRGIVNIQDGLTQEPLDIVAGTFWHRSIRSIKMIASYLRGSGSPSESDE